VIPETCKTTSHLPYYWPTIKYNFAEYFLLELRPPAPTPVVLNPKVHVQSFGLLPTTKNGYQFMISILNTASTYMHLVTMPNNTLSTLVNALLEYWLGQIGFPDKKSQLWDPKQCAKINREITWQLTNRNYHSAFLHCNLEDKDYCKAFLRSFIIPLSLR
jgi:hypothetical protein